MLRVTHLQHRDVLDAVPPCIVPGSCDIRLLELSREGIPRASTIDV